MSNDIKGISQERVERLARNGWRFQERRSTIKSDEQLMLEGYRHLNPFTQFISIRSDDGKYFHIFSGDKNASLD